ncbi:hypothetical protein [Acidisoma sp. C75]
MLDRVMATGFLVGALLLAAVIYHSRYAAPACAADRVSGYVLQQVQSRVGDQGVYLLNARPLSGGALTALLDYFAPHRACQVDVAPIEDMQSLDKSRWVKVLYSVEREKRSGKLIVFAHSAGLADPRFAANNSW